MAQLYKGVLLPAMFILPVLALWMRGPLNGTSFIATCCAVACLYLILPWATALNAKRHKKEYFEYLAAIMNRLGQSDVTSAERLYLHGRIRTLRAQYHLVWDPVSAFRTAALLARILLQCARATYRL